MKCFGYANEMCGNMVENVDICTTVSTLFDLCGAAGEGLPVTQKVAGSIPTSGQMCV